MGARSGSTWATTETPSRRQERAKIRTSMGNAARVTREVGTGIRTAERATFKARDRSLNRCGRIFGVRCCVDRELGRRNRQNTCTAKNATPAVPSSGDSNKDSTDGVDRNSRSSPTATWKLVRAECR